MLSENGDVIKIDMTGSQTVNIQIGGQTLPCGFSLNRVVVWTAENDRKTIGVDVNLFKNGANQLRFRLKTD